MIIVLKLFCVIFRTQLRFDQLNNKALIMMMMMMMMMFNVSSDKEIESLLRLFIVLLWCLFLRSVTGTMHSVGKVFTSAADRRR